MRGGKCGAKPHVGVTNFYQNGHFLVTVRVRARKGVSLNNLVGSLVFFFASSFLCCRASLSVDGLDQHPLTHSLARLDWLLTR